MTRSGQTFLSGIHRFTHTRSNDSNTYQASLLLLSPAIDLTEGVKGQYRHFPQAARLDPPAPIPGAAVPSVRSEWICWSRKTSKKLPFGKVRSSYWCGRQGDMSEQGRGRMTRLKDCSAGGSVPRTVERTARVGRQYFSGCSVSESCPAIDERHR
jgi:hypothetical protein